MRVFFFFKYFRVIKQPNKCSTLFNQGQLPEYFKINLKLWKKMLEAVQNQNQYSYLKLPRPKSASLVCFMIILFISDPQGLFLHLNSLCCLVRTRP